MLNELADLSRSLESRGIQTPKLHSWIKPFKKAEAIVAELNESGSLSRVSILSAQEVAALRNIAPDFHNSFPGLNLICPVLAVPDVALWNQPDALWSMASAASPESRLAYKPKDMRRLGRLLSDFPLKEVAPRLQGDGPKMEATLAVLKRLAQAKPEAEAFLRCFVTEVVAAAQAGRLSQVAALSILYGKLNKNNRKRDEWKTTLIFDVADMDRFRYRVADPAAAWEWSRLLFASDVVSAAGQGGFRCSLTGRPDTRMGDKMPCPTLGILGTTVLMSMNKAVPCQTRYGQTSTAVFRVGRNTVQALSDALQFVTDAARREKTWTGVPNGYKKDSDLLLAYLEEEPDADVPLAGLFADAEPNEGQELATYEARTARIHDALRLREKPGTDSHIKVVVLTKIDPGRAQVVFSARYSVAAIYAGRDRWLVGARNVPNISIPFPMGKGKPVDWRSGYQPSPTEVMSSFKAQWLRAGQAAQGVPGVGLGSVYALLLEPEASAQAAWLLDRYLGLTEPLMVGLARCLFGGASISKEGPKAALIAIAVYGILLLRQGRELEDYMESRDYLLGQFLQLADLLHKLYCVHERKGSIPPQLIGNAAIPMALQSPRRAIQVLGNRMPVYLAWADRYGAEGAGLAKWCRRELGRLSARLKDEDLDSRVTTGGKAELLLGYLANTKQNEKQESSL